MANPVFSSKDFKPELLNTFFQSIVNREEKVQLIRNWQKAIENGTVQKKKEEQLKGEFLDKFFGQVLGYPYESHEAEWNIEKEFKSISDGKKPDAALGFFDSRGKQDVRCVIEVKGGLINLDKKQNRADFQGSAIDQAFSYVPRMPGQCAWVIVTNMIEIRFYAARDLSRYESFLIPELLKADNLQRFFFLLSFSQLFLERGGSRIDSLFIERQAEQKKISTEFYNAYHNLRLALFADLRKSHPAIAPKKLFGHTQKLIDRIIFICFVRDRDLIGTVLTDVQDTARKSFSKSKERVWTELKHLFTVMNEGLLESGRDIPEFNGGLFKEDAELNSLRIKNNQLTEIINFVSSYDFQSQLDVNILGHIFEQSISDIEEFQSMLDGEKASETQISKRKKDGVYYTPDYITRYIVKEAVGGWLDDRRKEIYDALKITELPDLTIEDYETAGRTPNEKIKLHIAFWESYREQLKKIKVLDPACGSGAFLTQVFDYLWKEWEVLMADWNKLTRPWKEQLRDFIVSEPFAVYNGIDEWKAKKSIVANNIFGVDLNPESVEITKLSLWLKTANRKESLADLSGNIKQGNSLIDDPKVAGDDAFDWNKNFVEIMESGGFDVVVGNPPYVRAELLSENQINFFKATYSVFNSSLDLFGYFYEKASRILFNNGTICFISNSFSKTASAEQLRKFIQDKLAIKIFVDFNQLQVFDGATTYPVIISLNKNKSNSHFDFIKLESQSDNDLFNQPIYRSIALQDLDESNWRFEPQGETEILDKITKNKTVLEIYGKCFYGIKTGLNEAFITQKFNAIADSEHLKWIYEGKDIHKWATESPTKKLIAFEAGWSNKHYKTKKSEQSLIKSVKKDFEAILSHLSKFEAGAKARVDQGDYWWELRNCAYYDSFDKAKIIFPNLQNSNKFCFDESGAYLNAPAVFLPTNDLSLLALLNSKLIWFYLKRTCVMRSGGYLEVKPQYFEKIPIREISEKKKQPFITLANKMLELNKSSSGQSHKFLDLLQSNFPFELPTNKLKKWYDIEFIDLLAELEKAGAKIPAKKQGEWLALFKAEKEKIKSTQKEISKTDKEIDALVYQLYDLTPEEIEIVKKA
jgi:TaqI-like C-terminal specificity domain/N-6 DNA Methylase